MKNLLTRTLTGIVFVIVMIGGIYFGPLSMQLLFLLISLLTLNEFLGLVKSENISPSRVPVIVSGGVIYIAFSRLIPQNFEIAALCILPLLFIIELYRKQTFPFHTISYSIAGIIYIILPFALLVRMGFDENVFSPVLPISFFAILWFNDTFAYLTGMWLGRNRLFERISPKKSWEGSAGGAIAACIAAYIIFRITGCYSLTDWIFIAVIIVITGTLGDLTESLLKRSLHVKDSGSFLPGHGGLLDRFDAMLVAVPFVYIYFQLK